MGDVWRIDFARIHILVRALCRTTPHCGWDLGDSVDKSCANWEQQFGCRPFFVVRLRRAAGKSAIRSLDSKFPSLGQEWDLMVTSANQCELFGISQAFQ